MTIDHKARLEKLRGYLTADSDNFALLSEATDLSLQLADWKSAGELARRALALNPDEPVTRYRMAVALLGERKPEESLAITQSLLDAGITDNAVRYEHARGLAMSSRFADAEPVLAALLPEAETFGELPHLYIRVLHYQGKLQEAIDFAANYSAAHPDDSASQGMLSLLHLDNDQLAQAAEVSATALERAPDNLDALVTAGSVALAYENADEAQAHFDRALALQGSNGRAWVGLGLVHMMGTDLPAARHDFESAVQFMPTHVGSYNALAWIQILQRDYAAAKKTLEDSLEVDRNFGETHGGLGVLAAIEGDWENARRLSDTALRLQPGSFAGHFAKSLILQHRGHPERAQALVESTLKNFNVPGGGTLIDAVQRHAKRQRGK